MHTDAIEVVGPERAALTALGPLRPEHEVVDEQLAAPLEQLGQRTGSVDRLEPVALVDAQPRERSPPAAQFVALACELLFRLEKVKPRTEPILPRGDGGLDRQLHGSSLRRPLQGPGLRWSDLRKSILT